jgi:hypothetical protein
MRSVQIKSWARRVGPGRGMPSSLALLVTLLPVLLSAAPAAALEPAAVTEPAAQLPTEERARLVVLHRDGQGIPDTLRSQVDQQLLQSIGSQLRAASAYSSDVPFGDVELAAGCSARDPDCMQRIAASLGADWLLVRELFRDASGTIFLTLVAHDGPAAMVTRRAVGSLSAEESPDKVVPVLVTRLYPTPSTQDTHDERPSLQVATIAGWSATGAGLALITVGVVMGVLSRSAHSDYENTKIHFASDVDRAQDLLSRSQQRARVANGLLIGGAVTGVAGIATLVWATLRGRADRRGVELELTPEPQGAGIALSGAFGGAL